MEKLCSLLAVGLLAAVVLFWGMAGNSIKSNNEPARVQMTVAP